MSNFANSGDGVNPPSLPSLTTKGWVTLKTFATLVERDYRSVRRWAAEGRVKTIRVGGQIRIYEDEIRYILEHGTREPHKPQSAEPGA